VILAQLGGLALPYLVVLKGEANETGTTWTVIYKHSGYEGTEVMRTLIDSIGKAGPIQTQAAEPQLDEVEEVKPSVEDEVELSKNETALKQSISVHEVSKEEAPAIQGIAEVKPATKEHQPRKSNPIMTFEQSKATTYNLTADSLTSSDVDIYGSTFQRERETETGNWELILNHEHFRVDYEPFSEADVIGVPNELNESNFCRTSLDHHEPVAIY
jgi:hypothetical protein